MNRPNITPGPWHTNPDKSTAADVWTEKEGVRRFVACCPEGFKKQRQQTQDQWAENAQAIAAVPDLLAALEDCLQSLERMPETKGAYKFTRISEVKAALTKAGYTF